jgi:NarL family two-component system response regulator LiaR
MQTDMNDSSISVLLADDHEVTRTGLRSILESAPDIEVIGEAIDGDQARKLVEKLNPDVLLLDLKMPGLPSYEVEKWVRQHYPEVITLILTAHDRDFYLANMMEAGASGYLSKNDRAEKLVAAIRRAVRGEILFTNEQYKRVHQWNEQVGKKWDSLTNRERQTLRLLVQGLDNAQIAAELGVADRTSAFHVSNVMHKLGVNSRQEAIGWAVKHIPDLGENL